MNASPGWDALNGVRGKRENRWPLGVREGFYEACERKTMLSRRHIKEGEKRKKGQGTVKGGKTPPPKSGGGKPAPGISLKYS